jgi:hypothetical protein
MKARAQWPHTETTKRRVTAMAGCAELGEVRAWFDEHGEGEPLALLHPGGADARAWAPNLDALIGA